MARKPVKQILQFHSRRKDRTVDFATTGEDLGARQLPSCVGILDAVSCPPNHLQITGTSRKIGCMKELRDVFSEKEVFRFESRLNPM